VALSRRVVQLGRSIRTSISYKGTSYGDIDQGDGTGGVRGMTTFFLYSYYSSNHGHDIVTRVLPSAPGPPISLGRVSLFGWLTHRGLPLRI
jgi:hypothetical protein